MKERYGSDLVRDVSYIGHWL